MERTFEAYRSPDYQRGEHSHGNYQFFLTDHRRGYSSNKHSAVTVALAVGSVHVHTQCTPSTTPTF
jgi:hypothetical protein